MPNWKMIATGACFALLFGNAAQAQQGVYIGSGGLSLLESGGALQDPEHASSVGSFGTIGYRWDDGFSTEFEGGLRARQTEGAAHAQTGRGADERTTSFMMNARVQPPTQGFIKPYAGIGAGIAIINTTDHSLRERSGNVAPAGQAMAGFAVDLSTRTSVFAEYRYFKTFDQQANQAGGGNGNESHSGLFGLRVRLGGITQ